MASRGGLLLGAPPAGGGGGSSRPPLGAIEAACARPALRRRHFLWPVAAAESARLGAIEPPATLTDAAGGQAGAASRVSTIFTHNFQTSSSARPSSRSPESCRRCWCCYLACSLSMARVRFATATAKKRRLVSDDKWMVAQRRRQVERAPDENVSCARYQTVSRAQ